MRTFSLICLLLAAAGFILTAVARCDQRCPALAGASESDALTLSRIVVGESGWDSPDDQAAIYQVLLKTMFRLARVYQRPVLFREAAEAYSPRATGVESPRGRYAWVTRLSADGSEPVAWPTNIPWERYRDRWLVLLNRSRRLLAGELRSECDREPLHWAAPSLHERAMELGLVRVSCGNTLNNFYRSGRNAH